MNRFAFRIWNTMRKEMLLWPDIANKTLGSAFYYLSQTTMQWTGEKDRNGTDIYEGDILEESLREKKLLYIVYYDRAARRFDTKSIDSKVQTRPFLNGGTTKHLLIKGNIYETSEIAAGGAKDFLKKERQQAHNNMGRYGFRAWNIEYKRMIPWVKMDSNTIQRIFTSGKYAARQWTDMRDKEAMPIFEGDIVKLDSDPKEQAYIIYWGGCIGYCLWPIIPNGGITPSFDEQCAKRLKIIGNTDENPDIARYNRLEDIYEGAAI